MILYPSFAEKPATETYPSLDIATPSLDRTFDMRSVAPNQLVSLLDTVRWSASALNIQPWRFIITHSQDHQRYDQMLALLTEDEREWAQTAPVLLLAVTQTTVDGKTNPQARHDTGKALAQFTVKALIEGLFVQMTHDFSVEDAKSTFHIPDGYEPLVMIALGYQEDSTAFSMNTTARENGIAIRKNLTEIVFEGDWEQEPSWLR